tara:strand:+ start:1878 stop:2456 length:579 start_codon:yes stop_codon:yes gene_type:complete
MNHIWDYDSWKNISLDRVRQALLNRSLSSPKLGDITVRELCCLAKEPWNPVGIYVFSYSDDILYAGKTHGRSFQERMLSHIDHREPVAGSPHLAQLIQSMIKRGAASCADEAVEKVLDMKITWLPVPQLCLNKSAHKHQIAMTERRLLWHKCLNPRYNSPRVKKNDSFMLAGSRYQLTSGMLLGSPSPCKQM